jgi:hypothetical protein
MVVITTYAISGYHHSRCEFESRSAKVYWIQRYVIKFVCDFVAGVWFSLVSSTNKTDHHDITEILLKVALNTITLTLTLIFNKAQIQCIFKSFSNLLQVFCQS